MSFADGVTLLPALVKKFHDLHPDALVHLEAGYEPGLLKKLKDGDINFAILENESVEEGIATETLGYSQLLFCAPDKPPYNSTPQPVKIKTLLEWPMIIYEWDSGRHMVGNRHFRDRYGISLRDHNMVARFDTHEAMMNGARAGLGWTSVPRCIARRYRNDPNIIWFEVDTDPMRYPIDLVWNAERAISPLALEFMDFVRNNIPDGYFCSDDKL